MLTEIIFAIGSKINYSGDCTASPKLKILFSAIMETINLFSYANKVHTKFEN